MRVLVNALYTRPGVQVGAVQTVTEALFFHLLESCRQVGADLFILVSKTNAEYWRRIVPEAGLVMLPVSTGNQAVRIAIEQGACHWAVRKIGADVFYSPSGVLPVMPLPCKTVVYFQNILFFHFDEFYDRSAQGFWWTEWLLYYRLWDLYGRWAYTQSLKRATEVIAVSKTMAVEAETHTRVVRERPIRIVPYGVNAAFCPDSAEPRPHAAPYVVSVSSLVPHKNYEACIEIFADLKQRHRVSHDLCILGSGSRRYVRTLERLAADRKVGGSVKFVGHVPHQNLPAWYAHADAFMLTSSCESFGLPLLEAMASGTPVMASGLSGLAETVGEAGCLEDPARTRAFSDQLYRVLTDQDLREDLCRRGLEHAAGFTWPRAARSTVEVMSGVLEAE